VCSTVVRTPESGTRVLASAKCRAIWPGCTVNPVQRVEDPSVPWTQHGRGRSGGLLQLAPAVVCFSPLLLEGLDGGWGDLVRGLWPERELCPWGVEATPKTR